MKKIILATFALIFLLVITPLTFSTYELPDWYAVEDWEIETCSKWGGTAEAQSGSVTLTTNVYLYELTYTINAQKTEFPDNITLYEVGYYIQPITSDVEYSVRLKNKATGDNYNITIGATASAVSGSSGFSAFYSNVTYDIAQLGYKESSDSVIWTISASINNQTPTYEGGTTSGTSSGGTSGSSGSTWEDW